MLSADGAAFGGAPSFRSSASTFNNRGDAVRYPKSKSRANSRANTASADWCNSAGNARICRFTALNIGRDATNDHPSQ